MIRVGAHPVILYVLSAVVAAGCCSSKPVQAEPSVASAPDDGGNVVPGLSEPSLDNLFQQALDPAFTPDREVIVTFVQIPPNTRLERHWHPGEEFHYYLAGKVDIEIEGEETIHGTPGMVGHVPFRRKHVAVTGPEGAKIIVFRVHTSGEPVRYLDSH